MKRPTTGTMRIRNNPYASMPTEKMKAHFFGPRMSPLRIKKCRPVGGEREPLDCILTIFFICKTTAG